MRELPTIKAYRMVPVYVYPFKPYTYGGDQPISAEPQKRPKPPCEEPGCETVTYTAGFCQYHYYRYRAAVRKDPSLRKSRTEKAFTTDACGTSKGYQRHRYWKVPACDPCRDAANQYRNDRKAAKRAMKEAAA